MIVNHKCKQRKNNVYWRSSNFRACTEPINSIVSQIVWYFFASNWKTFIRFFALKQVALAKIRTRVYHSNLHWTFRMIPSSHSQLLSCAQMNDSLANPMSERAWTILTRVCPYGLNWTRVKWLKSSSVGNFHFLTQRIF